MEYISERVKTTQDQLLYAARLYSYCLDHGMNLIFSNCPTHEFFYNIFSVSKCCTMATEHFSENSNPIILSDRMGFSWIVIKSAEKEAEARICFHLCGPFFSIKASELYIRQLCRQMNLSSELSVNLLRQLTYVPTISFSSAISYTIILYYGIKGLPISQNQIAVRMETVNPPDEDAWTGTNWHGTWEYEQQMLNALRNGEDFSVHLNPGKIGTMSQDNPLRQTKNEMIVFVTLCIRVAIESGVSPEGAYNLSDYYIQRIEACTNISDVQNCGIEMHEVLLKRIRQCKSYQAYSSVISSCMEYITTHLYEKIILDEMAKELGYTAYYLSHRFLKETGESINEYIKRQKIEAAKPMLKKPGVSISSVSERLAFSSPSFFCSTFRKYTGMSPGQFIEDSRRGNQGFHRFL